MKFENRRQSCKEQEQSKVVVLSTDSNRFIEGITEARMAEVVGMVWGLGGGGLGGGGWGVPAL